VSKRNRPKNVMNAYSDIYWHQRGLTKPDHKWIDQYVKLSKKDRKVIVQEIAAYLRNDPSFGTQTVCRLYGKPREY
jgi:hypothetical protein